MKKNFLVAAALAASVVFPTEALAGPSPYSETQGPRYYEGIAGCAANQTVLMMLFRSFSAYPIYCEGFTR